MLLWPQWQNMRAIHNIQYTNHVRKEYDKILHCLHSPQHSPGTVSLVAPSGHAVHWLWKQLTAPASHRHRVHGSGCQTSLSCKVQNTNFYRAWGKQWLTTGYMGQGAKHHSPEGYKTQTSIELEENNDWPQGTWVRVPNITLLKGTKHKLL